jgi:nucleoside-diphosphate-sugar epimerase
MRCFVTGGSGFVGSWTVRRLVEQGWGVAVLSRSGASQHRLQGLGSDIELVEADLADSARINQFLRAWRPDACLHCAWYTEPGKYLESSQNLDCMRDSLALLELLVEADCRKIVMVGTCGEYDTNIGYLRESSAVGPSTLYAASKLATYLVATQRAAQLKADFSWARMFSVFGPGEDERRMAPALIRSLLSGREFQASSGDQVRDYLYVEDAAAGLVYLLQFSESGLFNVSSGEPISVRRLMNMMGDEIGAPDLIRFGSAPQRDWEPPFICGDSSRLRCLGWSPQYDLRQAICMTIEYWRTRGTVANT